MNDSLKIDDDDRYARFQLIGWWDQTKLQRASVVVVGAGALGNEVLKNLALLGVGRVLIVDYDQVEGSNLSRSVLFRASDAGQPKAQVAAAALGQLNPDTVATALVGNILTDVGLGTIRDADLVIGCLDNREARLWVNRMCWKVGRPWIDGGIQEINGVAKVFVPPDGPCYECGMTETDYQLIQLKYSCPLLSHDDIQSGKVPTAPTIASIIGGIQTQEALKLLHNLPTSGGSAFVFNGMVNQSYQTKFQLRDGCLSHEVYEKPIEVPLSAQTHSARQLIELAKIQLGAGEISIRLDRDFVVSLSCHACDQTTEVMMSMQLTSHSQAYCHSCGQMMRPKTTHRIQADSPLADRTLRDLGVPPYDIVKVELKNRECFFLLGADRPVEEP